MRSSVAPSIVPAVLLALTLAHCISVGSFSNFDPSVSSLTASPNVLLADGSMQSTLTLRIFYSPGVPAIAVPVQFTASTPNATIVPDSGLSDANGTFVATFTTTHRGTITVSTALGGQGSDSTLSATIITAAPAVHMLLVAGPALEADTPAAATVTLLDDTNSVVSGYRGTVQLTSSDTAGTLPPIHMFAASDAGKYTFGGLQVHTLGAQTLTATDIADPNLRAQVPLQVTRHREVRLTVPPPVVAGVPQTLQVGVTDLSGNTVANYVGLLNITCTDANALFPTSIALTAANAGSITLQHNVIFQTAGLQTLGATDAAVPDIVGSNPNILVLPAAATHLALTGLHSDPAGTAQTLITTALDAFDNVATGYRGRVRFASSDPQAALPPDTLFSVADAGVYTYPSVALLTVGIQSVTATDRDAPLITGNAHSLVITNAPANQLLVTASGAAIAGIPSGVVVSAFDPYHNQALDFQGTVTFTTTDPCAQLLGSHTFASADAGTFSFSVTYQTAGVQIITAQGPNIVGMAQQATIVSPAPMQALVLGGIADGPAGMARMGLVRAVDNFNNTVTTYRGVVHFSSSDPHAQLPADYGFGATEAGTKTFGLVLTTVGNQNVSVTDTSNPNWSGLQNDIVVAGGNSTLRVTCPNQVAAGVPFSVTVSAVDAYSNLDTNYTGTVHFTTPDSQGILPTDVTIGPSDNGSVTVSGFVLRTATTNQTVSAIDTLVASRDGMRTGIVVTPAAASTLVLVAPSRATAGAQLTVTAGAYDIYNNVVPTYTGTVHFVSSDYLATLPADMTYGDSDAGSRTYPHGVTLRQEGNQTITVSDGNIISATVTVAVADAGISTLVLSTVSPTIAGAPMDVTVTAEDAYGNVAQGYRGTVVITGQDPCGTYGAPMVFGAADDGNKFSPQQVTLLTAGSQLLTASDANNAAIAASNALVTVLPGPATLFALNAPATAQASAPFVATITVYDAYHNIARDYGGVATLQSDDTRGSPSNTVPLLVHFAAGLSDRQDVSGVTLRTAGLHNLTVRDSNNATAPTPATAQVNIGATAATRFALSAPTSVVAGATFSVTVSAMDSSGNIDTAYTGAIAWASGDTHATLPGPTTFGASDQGSVTVSGLHLPLASVGQTVQVTDAHGITGSVQIVVTAANAASLQLTGPSTATAGAAFSVGVAAWDIYNNTVTNYSGTVHFVTSDANGAVPGDTNFTVTNAGQRTFVNGVTLRTEGSQTVTVSDGSTTPATLSLQVSNAATSTLILTVPSTTVAGAPLNVTVKAEDAYGNTALDFNDTVVLSGQDPNGSFGAPLVFGGADQGSKTLSNYITLRASGSQQVIATDVNNNIVGIATAVVTVNPATISYLSMNSPNAVAASSPFSVTVTGFDAYNNVANTYAGTVALLSDDTLGTPSNTSFLTVHFVSGSAAVRTITGVTLRSAGNHNIIARDASNNVTPTPSTAVVQVAPAGATHFGLTLPTSVTAGSPFSAAISALDASGNTDTAYTGTLTWTSSDPNATAPNSTALTSGDQGSVTVSGLILQNASSGQTEQVIDANGITGSAQIAVTAASAASLQITGPSTTAAGAPFSVGVSAWDIYNNLVATYSSAVHFATSDGNGAVPTDTNFTVANAGQRTFVNGVTLRTDGNQTVTVSAGALTPATLPVQVHNGATSTLILSLPASTVAGTPLGVTVTAEDAYGNIALNFNDTVVLGGQDPNGSFGAPIVFSGADQGSKTLSNYVTLRASGSQVVTATDVNNNSVGISSAIITVNPATISYLSMNSPNTVAASSPFSVTVTGLDAYNNVANTYAGTVALLSDDTLGTPSNTSPLTVHFVSGSAAVRTFTGVTLRNAGNHNIIARDANNNVTPTPSTAVVQVVPAGTTHFGLTLPTSVTAGSPFSATISALDASGNTDTAYTGTLTWTSSDPNATAPNSTALTSGDQGSVTVSGLILQNASSGQTEQVIDANGITGSAQIAVTAASAASLQITGPSTTAAGAPFSVGVSAWDIYNNTVATYSGTVHFVTSDGNGAVPTDTNFTVANAGQRTFVNGVTLRTDGNQTVTVSAGALTPATLPVQVHNGATSTLILSLPASTVAGTPLGVTVTAEDAYGNIALNFNDTVVLGGQDPNGSFGAPIVFSGADQGSKTLANYVTLRASGSQVVTATDVNNNSVGISSAIITVHPATISYLSMNSPNTVAASSPFSVTVTGLDTYNNVANTYAGTVALLSDDTLGTPSNTSPLTVHFVSGSAAVRTITGVTLRNAGNHNIIARDANNNVTPTPSTAVVQVVPAGATHFGLTLPTSVTAGSPFSATISALDASGNTDTAYTGTLTWTSSDPNATAPNSTALTSGDQGSVTVSGLILQNASSGQTEQVVDANGIMGSAQIAVTAASAASLQITGPSTTAAGARFSVGVSAWDIYNNTVATYNGTVHFVTSDGNGAVPTDTNFTVANAGQRTFVNGVTLRTDGNQTVTVSAGALTPATLPVQVHNGATSTLILSLPASTVAGTPLGVTVTAEDAYGNIALNFNDTVVLGGQDPNGAFGAPIVFSGADQGSKTLANYVTLRASGSQVVTATDVNNNSVGISSAIITVKPATISYLSMNSPNAVVASSPFSVTVTGYDAYNNIANTYAGTVSLLSDDTLGTPSNTSALAVHFASGSTATRTITGVTLRTAGNHNMVAQDVNNNITPTPITLPIQVVPAGATHFGISLSTSAVAGSAFNATISALDASGNTDTNYTGTLTWTSSDSNTTMPLSTVFGSGNHGSIAVSGLILRAASSGQTLQVMDANGLTGSAQIAVTAASAATLQIGGPSTATAGAPFSVSVTAWDIYNNTVTTYGSTVHFVTSDPNGTVPGDTNFTVANAGRRTFVNGVTLRIDGNQTVTVSDGSLTSATLLVQVHNAAPSSLVLSMASSTVAGIPMGVTVTAEDAYGNLALNFNDTVVLSGPDPNGSYGAPIVFTSANQGTKTMPSYVTLKASGSQQVSATDANNNSVGISTAVVTVNPTTISYLSVTSPNTVAASSAFSVTVTGYDAYNNIANTYGGTVSLLSDDTLGTPSNTSPLTVHFASGSTAVRTVTGVTLHTAGNHNLTVQDANNGVTPTPSTVAVQVVSAGATHFGISLPTTVAAGTSFSATISALDASGNTDTTYTGIVTWSSSDPNATMPTTTTLASGGHGSITVSSLALQHASGGQTLQVVDANGLVGSATIAVTSAAGHALQLSGAGNVVAGAPFTLTVVARDIYNNTVTSYSNTVHFVTSDGAGAVPGNTNFTVGDAGSHAFINGATLLTDGNQTITVSDGSLISATLPVSVTNAPASVLALTLPATSTAGSALSVTLAARDAYGNLVVNFNDTVVLSGQDPNGVFGAPIVFSSADQGSKTLTNYITLKASGSQLVVATDANNTHVGVSNAIVAVSPGSIAYLAMNAPTSVASNSPFSVVITGYDIYNNVVTTYGGTDSLLSDDTLGSPSNTSPLTVHFASGGAAVRTVSGITLGSAGNHNLIVQDVNNAVTPTPNTVRVLVVPAGATHFGVTLPASVVAGASFSATVTALDASGNTDSNYIGTVTLTSPDAGATLPGSVSMGAGNHGTIAVSSLALRLATASQSLTATDTNGLTGTGILTVQASTAVVLQLAGSSNAIAGTPFTVSVTARDTYANVAAGYTGTVHFSGDGGSATYPNDFTFTSTNAGTKSFGSGVTLRAAGAQNVIISDGSLAAQYLLVQVHNAPADALVMTLPTSATAGTAFNVSLAAQDVYGNTATDYNGTIVMSSQDSLATYGSPFLFTPAQLGNTTINNYVTLRTSGYTLVTATDANHASVSPASVLMPVAAAGISRLDVQAPANANATVSIVVTLTGYDTYNNITSAYNGNVTMTSTDVQGTPSNSVPLTFHFASGAQAKRSVSGVILRTAGTTRLTAQDLATTSITSGNANVIVSPGAASQLNLTLPANTVAGTAVSPVVTAYDVSGNQAPSYRGTVAFNSSDLTATVPASHTFTGTDAGQYTATGALVFRTAGSQTVTVAASGVSADIESTTVKWASPNHLLMYIASSAQAGTTLSPNVVCLDAFGNTVQNYNGTVHFNSTDANAALPPNTTFGSGDLGQHIFTNLATLKTAGNQNITVTDTSPGPIGYTVTTAVSVAQGVQLALQVPASVTAGTAFDVRVVPYDAYGNPNAIFSGVLIALTAADSQASISQTTYTFPVPSTSTLLLSGAVTLRSAGVRVLSAKEIYNTSDNTTANITVNPASLSRFTFGPREIVTAGTSFNTALAATDTYGNAISSFTGSVTLASTDPSGSPASGSPSTVTFTAGNSGVVTLTGISFSTLEHQSLTATSGGTTGKGHYLVRHNMSFTSGQTYDFSMGGGSGSAPSTTKYAGAMSGAYTTSSGVFYLPDTGDNRVLIFNSFPTSTNQVPDGVLGQTDFVSSNSGTDANHFSWPIAVTGDGNGGLFISDYLNYRVLHYNTAPSGNVNADGVLGQPNFTSTGCSCTRVGMCEQASLQVLSNQNTLLVADRYQNRVLIYRPIPRNNGINYATMVLGQPDFTSCNASSAGNGLNEPMSVWSDGNHLAVADQVNHRVLLWNAFNTVLANGISGVTADYVIGQTSVSNSSDPGSGSTPTAATIRTPNAIEGDGTHLFVIDGEYTRVTIYNSVPTTNNVSADKVLMQSNLTSTGCSSGYCGGDGLYIHDTHLMVGVFYEGVDYLFASP